jgi:hypothetical protein
MTAVPTAATVQVVGAQLSPETEDEAGQATQQKISPWSGLVYRNTPSINMISLIGIKYLSR